MGVQVRGGQKEGKERQAFMKRLLRDVRALEMMLGNGMIESGVRRIGAEQELFLVNNAYRPACKATEVLAEINDPLYEHELGLYNLEFSVEPLMFGGKCLSQMEEQLVKSMAVVREAAARVGVRPVMTGILPTIEKSDLGLHNQTPNPRYRLLNDTLSELRGNAYEINIRGADEIIVTHDDVMLESANTSFQVHFQVGPEEFSKLYNVAQAVCAPVLSAATNSPLLFGRRLWRETRIALFQQSVDTRASGHHMRDIQPRVSFGENWVQESVLDIIREDIARFRVLFAAELDDRDPLEAIADGEVPGLGAFRLHNSTIYRWNRPCYGINPGESMAHLRIENRVLPAGPTPRDEVANAAFWFGLMSGVLEEYGDITKHMDFDDARANFVAAARHGLSAPITWVEGSALPAHELIQKTLLPLAKEGLKRSKIADEDAEVYLEIIEERVRTRSTGSNWQLRSFNHLKQTRTHAETLSALTSATLRLQETNEPVHTWPIVAEDEHTSWKDNHLRVSQFMSRNLFTLNQDEPIEFAASLMTWHHIHWIPVEDHEHNLVGLITHDQLLKLFAEPGSADLVNETVVSSVMQTDVPAIGPNTLTTEALAMMYEQKLSCLPVVDEGKLIGMVTERDVMSIARQLLEERLAGGDGE
ncbi:MAG: CBS domain-containing protein [Myxococcota bacterium]|jgi:CBS domain-containing protein/gamma-glutamylcysteine synthetase|nr:CBS domain-containing protein [Myxococcota bacterium]